jgi:DNA-binding SARP family transcriptional activator
MTDHAIATPQFDCQVFGTFQVRVHGVPAQVGGPKQRLLLAVLLCRANSVVRTPELIDALWGAAPPRTVHKNIQVCVSKLRKIFGDRLSRCGRGYQLRMAPAECDLLRFGQLVTAARRALMDGSTATAADLFTQGVALWSAPPFAGVDCEGDLEAELERWYETYLAAVEDWAELLLDRGEWYPVLDRLGALVRQHPLRERLAATWMRALVPAGRRSEALAHYDVVRRKLSAELGLEPSDALRLLYQQLLRGESWETSVTAASGSGWSDRSRANAAWLSL